TTFYRLSARETQLLQLALAGRNNDEAADELGCARATIGTFWNRIFRKTGVSGQRDLMILLLRHREGSAELSRAPAQGARLQRSWGKDRPCPIEARRLWWCGWCGYWGHRSLAAIVSPSSAPRYLAAEGSTRVALPAFAV